MDPVTHTLVGATLARTPLARTPSGYRTRLAVPACILGANLPDVDVFSYVAGGDTALAFRRGITHGLPALVVLPAIFACLLWLWVRVRKPREGGAPLSVPWLFGLSYIAVATHPVLDWLNTYGMRWGLPISGEWTYGDSVFIMDPWLWLVLGGAWLLGRKPTARLVISFTAIAALLVAVTASRAPSLLPVLAVFLAVLLALASLRPAAVARSLPTWAIAALAVAVVYIGALLVLHGVTERRVIQELDRLDVGACGANPEACERMVGPRPANPLTWDVVVRDGEAYRFGVWRWSGHPGLELRPRLLPAADADPLWDRIRSSGQQEGFLEWARFPWIEVEREAERTVAYLMDARYVRRRTTGFGGARFDLGVSSEP